MHKGEGVDETEAGYTNLGNQDLFSIGLINTLRIPRQCIQFENLAIFMDYIHSFRRKFYFSLTF